MEKRNYNKHGHLLTRAMRGGYLRIGFFTKGHNGINVDLEIPSNHLDKLAAASFALLGYRVTPGLKKLGLEKRGHRCVCWVKGPEWILSSRSDRKYLQIYTDREKFDPATTSTSMSAGFTFRGADLKEYKEELCKAAGWELEV